MCSLHRVAAEYRGKPQEMHYEEKEMPCLIDGGTMLQFSPQASYMDSLQYVSRSSPAGEKDVAKLLHVLIIGISKRQ
jgi:hypothetical protein